MEEIRYAIKLWKKWKSSLDNWAVKGSAQDHFRQLQDLHYASKCVTFWQQTAAWGETLLGAKVIAEERHLEEEIPFDSPSEVSENVVPTELLQFCKYMTHNYRMEGICSYFILLFILLF